MYLFHMERFSLIQGEFCNFKIWYNLFHSEEKAYFYLIKFICNYSEPSPKIMSALPEKAAVNASNALMPCLLPVLMNDINLT